MLSISFLYSCSKERRTLNKLEGDWDLSSFKVTSDEGWTVFPSFEGELKFKEPKTNDFQFRLLYWEETDTLSFEQTGIFELTNEGENLTCFNSTGDSIVSTYRILTLTSTDLQLEELLSTGFVRLFQFRKRT
jgi:hypothetical protein